MNTFLVELLRQILVAAAMSNAPNTDAPLAMLILDGSSQRGLENLP